MKTVIKRRKMLKVMKKRNHMMKVKKHISKDNKSTPLIIII